MQPFNPLIRKLENFCPLPEDDERLLITHTNRSHEVRAKQDIIREGDKPDGVHLILSGFACRYKVLKNGTRQIMAFLVPGDFCDLHVSILNQMDHSIAALSRCRVSNIPVDAIAELTSRPTIARALQWTTLVDEAILREWIVGLGRRPAEERVAHILCELQLRLFAVGLVEDGVFAWPITQNELADTLGLTPVHLNRMLQTLRNYGLIDYRRNELVIRDAAGLKRMAGFDPKYLHLS